MIDREEKERCTSVDDMATQQEAEFLADAIERQARAVAINHPTGNCANCHEDCAPGTHFCDADCRGDHERREQADKLWGRRR